MSGAFLHCNAEVAQAMAASSGNVDIDVRILGCSFEGVTESEIIEALRAREPIFHRPEFGTSRADFERMTDDAFWEVGASGRIYDRQFVLDNLEDRYSSPHADEWEVAEFACRALGSSIFLVTYLLKQGSRRTRRSTLWRYTDDWVAIYHQGTLADLSG